MKWKRCNRCQNLKPIDNFWKKGNGYQSKCIKCMKMEYQQNKDKKKEYDKIRYQKVREEKEKEIEFICMRCEEFVANVKNNVMYWCFHCLFKYENESKQKIPVEIINPVIRRSKYFEERKMFSLSKPDKEKMEKLLKNFTLKLEDKDLFDEKIKNSIIKLSNIENKEEIMQDFISKIETHKSYDDEAGIQFPYKGYIDKFLED